MKNPFYPHRKDNKKIKKKKSSVISEKKIERKIHEVPIIKNKLNDFK